MNKIEPIPSGCWLWKGGHNRLGYGLFRDSPTTQTGAHRFSYTQFVGPIPDKLTVDHRCRNPSCVNPEHLRLLTVADNLRDRHQHTAPATHCKRKHPFTGANLYIGKYGKRYCRTCDRIRHRARRTRWETEPKKQGS